MFADIEPSPVFVAVKDFLTAHKISYKNYGKNDFQKFKDNISSYRACVVIISGHAFCIVKRSKNNYKTLGFYNNDNNFKDIYWDNIKNIL